MTLIIYIGILLIVVSPAFAQGASTADDGGGIPLPLIALGVVILAFLTRNIAGIGSRRSAKSDSDSDDDTDDDDSASDRRQRQDAHHDEEERLNYLIERDDVWERDGYTGEDDGVDF
ncbi:MAG TPA: hypothetical protein VJZ27_19045 [Aggregatilineales bacterium]|nr:hypothetical protein [Aggregatilineales bacterium]